MKRILAFVTALMLLVPAFAAAAPMSAEEIVLSVKARIDIPEEYTEFTSNIDKGKEGTMWSLNWSKPQKMNDYGNISVNVNESGRILYIYSYDSREYAYSDRKKLPVIDRDEAKELAVVFLKRVNPGLAGEFDVENPEVYVSSYDGSVNFTFYRTVNGYLYLDNSISINVSGATGKVTSYSLNYADNITFPPAGDVIGEEKAIAALAEKGAIKLVYTPVSDGAKSGIKLMYVPQGNLSVDAQTGELLSHEIMGYYYGDAVYESASLRKTDASPELSEKEREELERMSALISPERAEEILRAVPEFEIPSDAVVEYSSVSRAYAPYPDLDNRPRYVVNLNLTQKVKGSEAYTRWYYGTLDAETGEVINFGQSDMPEDAKGNKITLDDAKAKARAFLEKYKGDKLPKLVEKPQGIRPVIYDEEQGTAYLYYVRQENGIEFEGNYVSMSISLRTGRIIGYNESWIAIDSLPEPAAAVPPLEAAKTIAAAKAPVLAYINDLPPAVKEQEENVPVNTVLAYTIRQTEFRGVDALTGDLVGYDGKVYYGTEDKPYTDIEGHYSEKAVKALAEIGIRLPGEQFMPDAFITQKEYATLIAQCVLDFYPIPRVENATNEVYNLLISKGVITEAEMAPDSTLTRETAVKYLLSAMGLAKIGGLEGIYAPVFSDFEEIAPSARGFAALAKGLGIIGGIDGKFMPKKEMTRAEAVTVIYNYLSQ